MCRKDSPRQLGTLNAFLSKVLIINLKSFFLAEVFDKSVKKFVCPFPLLSVFLIFVKFHCLKKSTGEVHSLFFISLQICFEFSKANMIGRILYYPTLAWNVGWSSLTGRPWYDRLDETVLLGALPLKSMMKTVSYKFLAQVFQDK